MVSVARAQALAPTAAAASGIELRTSQTLTPLPRGDAGRRLPVILRAREIRGRPDLETVAEGDAEFRRGGLVIGADRLSYDQANDLATARGQVRAERDGNIYTGSELQLHVQRFEGFFLEPTYYFSRFGAGGTASRIDFVDDQRATATGATYTSCNADGSGQPAWLLTTDRVRLDLEANEGVAEGAVLRFLGVPILGAPVLSFPLSDERKSGWLPPSVNIDNKSGIAVSAPYYWNIAPNRDATFTPGFATRRGQSIGAEFRYLEPKYAGDVDVSLLPQDRAYGHRRYSLNWLHDTTLADAALTARVLRVSDNDYWKDFPRSVRSLTPRLLLSDVQADRTAAGWDTYARALRWQVLQSLDSPIDAPYERLPQIGARTIRTWGPGLEVKFEGEYNRFINPENTFDDPLAPRPTGSRMHGVASIARPWITPAWSLTPRLSVNTASYSLDQPLALDGRRRMSRVIPTFSLDTGWVLERDATMFDRAFRQTLEPRLLYVNTPYRDQARLPNFDSAAKDFNFESIYSENPFSGIDRVADAHQLTAGVTTRMIDPETGAEAMRLGIVQRYLLRDQQLTPEGTPQRQRFSDVLLLGSTRLVVNWALDAGLQYNPEINRIVRSIVGARYSPGPFRTINANYRLARGVAQTEQVELGWQWPVYDGRGPGKGGRDALRSSSSCSGALYSVGRINYNRNDSRVTDSIIGFEYDAGCWIGRVVAERLSTGRSEATTRLLLQLELIGLSRLGSNPLQVLKDNIPGYRLLRDSRGMSTSTSSYE